MAITDPPQALPETPILDSGILPIRAPRKRSLVATMIGFFQGVCFGLIMVRVVGDQASGDTSLGLGLMTFFAALSISTLVHELGHLSAGWIMGFRFSFISVGPVSLSLVHGKPKVHIRREGTALGYAGMHIGTVRGLRRRLLIFGAAGSATQLLFVPFVVLLARTFPISRHSWTVAFVAQFVMISVLLSVVSLVPFGRSSSNDGSRIAMLLKEVPRSRRHLSNLAIGAQQRNGVRPKNWKQTWLRAATALEDESVDEFSGNLLAYVSAAAKKDPHSAGHHLERCLKLSATLGTSRRDGVAREAAVFSAWFRKDSLLAEKWLAQVKKPGLIERLSKTRINVAMFCSRSNFDAALDAWNEGFTFIETLPKNPGRESLRDGWLEWRTEIQERQDKLATASAAK